MKTKSHRVVVPNTVYLTNLPPSLTEQLLWREEFLGMYGKLEKVRFKCAFSVFKNASSIVQTSLFESVALKVPYFQLFWKPPFSVFIRAQFNTISLETGCCPQE
jgi:hypothetical protein